MAAANRVLVAGISGAGKTTMARALAQRLNLPRYELDALHHGPGWVKRPEFEDDVARLAAEPRWVTEAQYSTLLGDLLWKRADLLVWLDLPRATVMRRVLWRSFTRAATRRELWNGNRESFRAWLEADHPIRWAWSQHATRRAKTEALVARHPHLTVIRLRTPTESHDWLAALDDRPS